MMIHRTQAQHSMRQAALAQQTEQAVQHTHHLQLELEQARAVAADASMRVQHLMQHSQHERQAHEAAAVAGAAAAMAGTHAAVETAESFALSAAMSMAQVQQGAIRRGSHARSFCSLALTLTHNMAQGAAQREMELRAQLEATIHTVSQSQQQQQLLQREEAALSAQVRSSPGSLS